MALFGKRLELAKFDAKWFEGKNCLDAGCGGGRNSIAMARLGAKQAELPIGRFGQAHEVAPTALLLASSPGGDLYTGQTLGPNSGDVMP